jgi:hypothetical protein
MPKMQMDIQPSIMHAQKARLSESWHLGLALMLTCILQAGYLDIVRWLCEKGGANVPVIQGEDGSSIPGVDIRSKGGWTPLSAFFACDRESLR